MNRSPSNKPGIPRPVPAKKTPEEIAEQERNIEKVDDLSAEPLKKSMKAAGLSVSAPEEKGRAKAKKTNGGHAPQAAAPVPFVYPWNHAGLPREKGFSTRIPGSIHAKLVFLASLDKENLAIGKVTTEALEEKTNELLRARGILV